MKKNAKGSEYNMQFSYNIETFHNTVKLAYIKLKYEKHSKEDPCI